MRTLESAISNQKWIAVVEIRHLSIFCVLFSAICFLSSCFKEKPLIPPLKQGEVQIGMIEMGPQYADQFFYSLEKNSVISQNSRLAYDLMFDCNSSSFYILLNTAKFMSVVHTGKTDLNSITMGDASGKKWMYETGRYLPDSSALGEWWSALGPEVTTKGEVYIINLGVDTLGDPLGYIKMKVNDFSASEYSITYSDMDNQHLRTVSVSKDVRWNYRYFRFVNDSEIVDGIEPDKNLWDFCLTQYSYLFYDPYYLPYQVTGVLTNPSRTEVYMDSILNFDSIQFGDFNSSRLETRRDAIGFEWKRYGLNSSGTYSVNSNYTYYIRTGSTDYYKLRFNSFDRMGITGYPVFEYVRL
ncbi:MAG: hypothetical protein IPP77_02615 [Bacteroidetes bacterium]|nr:hypothetical protein [Bacteroidota bacterium]